MTPTFTVMSLSFLGHRAGETSRSPRRALDVVGIDLHCRVILIVRSSSALERSSRLEAGAGSASRIRDGLVTYCARSMMASRPEDMNLPGFCSSSAARLRKGPLCGQRQRKLSAPAETGGSRSAGRKATPSTSIWKIITEDGFDGKETPQARLAAHASRRTSARGNLAGA